MGSLGLTAIPSQDINSKFRLFSYNFQEEAKASEGLALEEIFLNRISQFGKIVYLAITHFVFLPVAGLLKVKGKRVLKNFPLKDFEEFGFRFVQRRRRSRTRRPASAREGCRCTVPLCFPTIIGYGPGSRDRLAVGGAWEPVS